MTGAPEHGPQAQTERPLPAHADSPPNPNASSGAVPRTDPSPLPPVHSRRFVGRVALVTGSASGIGLATARRFGQEGARVVIADLQLEAAQAAAEQVRAAGAADVLALACDVSDEVQVRGAVQGVMARFGQLDVVVNNAGLMTFRAITELSGADWRRVLDVDLLGSFYLIREAFLVMKPGSSVVNVSSIHAVETSPLVSPYAAAKAAALSLTRSAAIEGTPLGIRVNAVLPGAVNTGMLWDNPNVKSGAEQVDHSMVGEPEDLAAAIAFLASAEARFVQGASLVVDGGRTVHL